MDFKSSLTDCYPFAAHTCNLQFRKHVMLMCKTYLDHGFTKDLLRFKVNKPEGTEQIANDCKNSFTPVTSYNQLHLRSCQSAVVHMAI